MFGDRFSSSTTCSRWRHETEPGRLDQSLSCRFWKVATHPYIGTRVRRDDRPGGIAKVERRHTARRRGVVGSTRLVRLGLDVQHFKASGRIPRRAALVARQRATLATGNWRGTFRHHQLRLWHPDATSPTFSMSAMAKNGNPGSVCMGPDLATKYGNRFRHGQTPATTRPTTRAQTC